MEWECYQLAGQRLKHTAVGVGLGGVSHSRLTLLTEINRPLGVRGVAGTSESLNVHTRSSQGPGPP